MSEEDGFTSEPEWVNIDDGATFADEDWYRRQIAGDSVEAAFSDVSVQDFVAIEEPTAESLLGEPDETLLPANGTLLMYGDGGAGKTTLTLDAVCSLGVGQSWLGLEVGRPVRSLLIENEGPRGMFRKVLREKASHYNGSLGEAIRVVEEPWSQFTLRDERLREQLASAINNNRIDLLVMGPVATIGMVGGGTPDEISAFEGLLRELRRSLAAPVAIWLVHHENKSGDVSGAWERVPDTLIHVQGVGNGHTRVVFRKARWSSEYHGRSLNLAWRDGRSFELVEEEARDYYADVLDMFREDDRWRTVDETAKDASVRRSEAKSVLAELTRRGDLTFEQGPAGRSPRAHCWRLAGLRLVETDDRPSPDDDFAF